MNMIISKFLDPKNDFAFRQIFGSDINKDIVISFVNAILDLSVIDQIKNVKFLKPIEDPEISSQKQSIVDILCSDSSGKNIIIQMQVCRIPGFEKRAQHYAAKAYTSQFLKGDVYENLKGVVFIAIVDFIHLKKNDNFLSNHVTIDMVTYEPNLSNFSFTFIELPKFNKGINELSDIKDKWIFFIKNANKTSEQDVHHIMGEDKIIGEAYEILNMFNWKQNDLYKYEEVKKYTNIYISSLKEKYNKGFKIGYQEGRQKGFKIGREEIIKNLLKAGSDAQIISQASGMSIIDIEKLL